MPHESLKNATIFRYFWLKQIVVPLLKFYCYYALFSARVDQKVIKNVHHYLATPAGIIKTPS
jgi:hypothetical protein